jgi:hypothetical protein
MMVLDVVIANLDGRPGGVREIRVDWPSHSQTLFNFATRQLVLIQEPKPRIRDEVDTMTRGSKASPLSDCRNSH